MSDTDFWLYPAGVTNQARAFDQWAEMVQSCTRWVTNHNISNIDDYPACYEDLTALHTMARDASNIATGSVTRFAEFDRRRVGAWSK